MVDIIKGKELLGLEQPFQGFGTVKSNEFDFGGLN
jgi:hypothetical protein